MDGADARVIFSTPMERPILKPVGTPVEELDTPVLVVDLDALEHNIETVHSFFTGAPAKLRPHVESHRCPAITHLQMAAGGTVGGISVATVGEAEVFAQHGFSDILIASPVVISPKIARLCALARRATMAVAVDSPKNARDLSDAAQANGATLRAVVEVSTGLDASGVDPGEPAVELARAVHDQPGLRFAGYITHGARTKGEDGDALATEARSQIQRVLDTREEAERVGLEVGMVAAGGTSDYDVAGSMAGVTDVAAGSYALMDYRHSKGRPELRPAARVMSTVTSHPEPGRAITDSGQKSVGIDLGLPVVEDLSGVSLVRMSAEHGLLDLDGAAAEKSLDVGAKVWLTPWDAGDCVNLYDYIHVARDGRLEAVWDVSARGQYR